MKKYSTDIAAEIYAPSKGKVPAGVNIKTHSGDNLNITTVDILKHGLNREKGRYITIEMANMMYLNPTDEGYIKAISKQIRSFLPSDNGKVLVVGVGNRAVAADSLGPLTADKIFVTNNRENLGIPLRQVACIAPGVSGATGISTARLIHSVCMLCAPSCVILVDSICTSKTARLGACVQISNTGLTKNGGETLNKETLGVDVIAVGVPMVINLQNQGENTALMMTPKDVNALNESASSLLALCINKALQNALSIEELSYIVS